jgi:hypothetical protein
MKKLIFLLLLITACYEDDYISFKECYLPGDMQCQNNRAMMCENDYMYWTFQDCNSINQTCVYNQPELQSGYTGLATCENI